MNDSKKIEETAKKIRNEIAKEWRKKNKAKVREINNRYWLNRAKKVLESEEQKNDK